jgi:hypothetical protein
MSGSRQLRASTSPSAFDACDIDDVGIASWADGASEQGGCLLIYAADGINRRVRHKEHEAISSKA